jgi:hypothetical protein
VGRDSGGKNLPKKGSEWRKKGDDPEDEIVAAMVEEAARMGRKMPVTGAQPVMQKPARKAECCFGSIAILSEIDLFNIHCLLLFRFHQERPWPERARQMRLRYVRVRNMRR